MRAVAYTRYGPPNVLQIVEVPKPAPSDGEILIRVHATTVTIGDCRLRGFRFPRLFWFFMRMQHGVRRPGLPIPGSEFSGVIESVGKDVKSFNPGDQVFGSTGMRFAANAEYVCLPKAGVLTHKPANMTHEEAAAVPFGALAALHFLRQANLLGGQKVLINGASGSLGTYAVQLVQYFGANASGVCSTSNLDLVRSLGAENAIDYTQEDFTETGDLYDVVFDAVGKSSASACRKLLAPSGTYVSSAAGLVQDSAEDLVFLKGLIEAGRLRAVIDRCYPLEQIAEAHRYVELGHKKGNVVITLVQGGATP